MKWMIASDLHGSQYYCKKMFEAFEREQADRLLLLGDLLYHGPRNDLPEGYDPKAVIRMLNEHKDVILCVRGNCDAEVDQMVLEFPIMTEYAIISNDEHIIFATHGHVFNEKNPPCLNSGDVLLNGHTHVHALTEHENYTYMNPGSVSLPKSGSYHGYMTFENGTFEWKDLDGTVIMKKC